MKEHRIEAEGEIVLVFFSGDMLTCALRVKRYNVFLCSTFSGLVLHLTLN